MHILIGLVLVVVLFLIGIAVIGLAAKLVWWLLVGIAIGALARLVLPGVQPIGILATALYGAGGALLGGIIGRSVLHVGFVVQFLISIAIAAVLVAVFAGTTRTQQLR